MSKRDDRVSLVDMLIYAEEAIEILGETGLKAMVGDRVMQLALQRLVETVGEAARRVSQQTQEQHPAIAWRQIYRNEKSPGSCLRPSGSQSAVGRHSQ